MVSSAERMSEQVYIPIGADCTAARYLREQELRSFALPFDWIVIPPTSAITLIHNNFEGYFNRWQLKFLRRTPRVLIDETDSELKFLDELITPVVCKRFHILYPHDFSKRGRWDYRKVKAKYQKRIQRLRDLLHSDTPKTLIYHPAEPNPWQIEQYRRCKITPQPHDPAKILTMAKNLNFPNLTIQSLDELKKET